MTNFYLFAVPGNTIPDAPSLVFFQVHLALNSHRGTIHAASFENASLIFRSLKPNN